MDLEQAKNKLKLCNEIIKLVSAEKTKLEKHISEICNHADAKISIEKHDGSYYDSPYTLVHTICSCGFRSSKLKD